MSGFWTNQGHEYVSGSEYARFLNKPGSWLSQVSEYTKALNMRLVLNLPWFWIRVWFWICQGSEYVRVTQDSEYTWICLIMSRWICLDMFEYPGIWVNMPKSAWIAFVLYFPIVVPCLLEGMVTYFNVLTSLEVLVWIKMRLFSWRETIWFSGCKYFTWFLF